jgi:hypothetical protein
MPSAMGHAVTKVDTIHYDSDADPDPRARAIISPHKLHLMRLLGDIVSPVFNFHSKFHEEN